MTTPCWLTYPKSILIPQNTSYCTSGEASVSTINQDKRSFWNPVWDWGAVSGEQHGAALTQKLESFFRPGKSCLGQRLLFL